MKNQVDWAKYRQNEQSDEWHNLHYPISIYSATFRSIDFSKLTNGLDEKKSRIKANQ